MPDSVPFEPGSVHPFGSRLHTVLLKQPALLVTFFFGLGITAAELTHQQISWGGVALLEAGAAGTWGYLVYRKQFRLAVPCLLLVCFLTGMLRLHFFYLPETPRDISRLVTEKRRLVKVRGWLESRPVVKQKQVPESAPDWQRIPSTRCQLRMTHLLTPKAEIPFSGRLWLTVRGAGLQANRGDEVELTGWLEQPALPSNPGEFDFRTYLKRQKIAGILRVKDPQSIQILEDRASAPGILTGLFRFTWSNRLTENWQAFAGQHLSPPNRGLAAAMLLGVREEVSEEQQTRFSNTGTMHFLAVSGLHVGILVTFLVGVGLLLRIPGQWLPYVLIVCIWLYAVITDLKPPVTRAALLATFLFLGIALSRRATLLNLLALAALVLLFFKPTQIFETGTQLSFLAVAGIIWGQQFFSVPVEDTPEEPSPVTRFFRWLFTLYRITFSIWLFTAPLVLAQFHLFSPIGLIINVVLIPVVIAMLWCGYLMSFSLLFSTWLASLLAVPFDGLLTLFQKLVELANLEGWGTIYAAGPTTGWLLFYYLFLTGLAMPGLLNIRLAHSKKLLLAGLFVASLASGLWTFRPVSLRVTILSVGHGSAVVIDYPNGKRLVYDAGSTDGGQRATQAVQHHVWNSSRPQIDCFLASHADIDHFNGISAIMKKIPVGTILFSPQFLDFDQPAVEEFVALLQQSRANTQIVQAGDELLIDSRVQTRILFPGKSTNLRGDNNHSVVLLIEYAGRKVLLTGDLENEGQQNLAARLHGAFHVDVLASPHHGAREANRGALFQQYTPDYVTISTNRPGLEQRLRPLCKSCQTVFSTRRRGAITFEITPQGNLDVHPFR